VRAATAIEIRRRHTGIMQSLFQEFEQHRLPRLLRLKDKVDSGVAINDVDFDFLCKEINDACVTKHLIVHFPELEEFCLHLGHLYKELCDRAVENEKG
jgi:hypothetical protein